MAFGKTLTSIGVGLALVSQAGIASAQMSSASRLSIANAIPANARVGARVEHANHLGGTALIVAGLAAAVAIAAIIVATDNNDNNNPSSP